MLNRQVEDGLLDVLDAEGIGCIAYSPLAQGLLTGRYLDGIPADSRAAGSSPFLKKERITPELVQKLKSLNELAQQRGQSLAQMALAWLLKDRRVTSVLIGASRPEQVAENVAAAKNTAFSSEELARIDSILQ
jgi:L-glyceraldehyde 3-phosphate reductase